MKFLTYILPVLLAPALMAFGDAHYFAIRDGNELYDEGDYDGALELYNRARDAKDSDVSNYNLGNAYFQKGEYEKAAEFFSKTLTAKNMELAEKSLSNMAVTRLKAGYEKLENDGDKSAALDDFKEAAGAYRKILLDDSSSKAAKENMELATKKIEELEKQMPPQKKGDEKQKKDGKDEQKAENENERQSKGKDGGEDKKSDDKKEGKDGDKNERQSKENDGEKNDKEMSPEDVKRVLDALAREEQKVLKNLRLKKRRQREVEKDW